VLRRRLGRTILDVAAKTYQANLGQADFRTRAEPARAAINDWVGRKTRGKITELLQPGLVDRATRLGLANAIYFVCFRIDSERA
jgi:serpin B